MKYLLVVFGLFLLACGSKSNTKTGLSTDPLVVSDAGDNSVDSSIDFNELDASVDVDELFSIDVMLASDIDSQAPGTVGIVTFELDGVTVDQADIQFGLTADYGMEAPVDLDATNYRTLLLGMKSNSTYHFRVRVLSDKQLFVSDDRTLETGPSTNLVSVDVQIEDALLHEPGYILATQLQGTTSSDFLNGSIVFILDSDGNIVWWYESQVGQTSRAHLALDGKSMWLIPDRGGFDSAEIERVSLDTLESTLYDEGASHDAIPAGEDMLAFIEYGEGDCGSIYELYEDGETKEIFESSELLPGLVPNECHTNAIRYYPEWGIYTVSDFAIDIFVIDTAGELQWRLTDYISNDAWGMIQHGHQFLGDSMLLFANRGGEQNLSAVIEYSLPDGEELFKYDPGIISTYYGDAQRLPGGNTLAVFSVAGVIHEVSPDGEPVMTLKGDPLGYAVWHDTLYL